MTETELERLDENRLLVPRGYIEGMNVNGIIYADEKIARHLERRAIEQEDARTGAKGSR